METELNRPPPSHELQNEEPDPTPSNQNRDTPAYRQTHRVEPHGTTNEADTRTKEIFSNIHALFEKTDPVRRPPIPKVNPSRKVSAIIQDLNENILPNLVNNSTNIESLQTIVYCSAITVAIRVGKNVNINQNNEEQAIRPTTKRDPPWLRRINKNIEELRSAISRVRSYLENSHPSRRSKHKIRRIFKEYNVHSRYENNNEKANRVLDTLKQKLAVQVQKRKKYTISNQRKTNNQLFNINEKKFYRNLRQPAPDNPNPQDLPLIEHVEEYWSSLWSTNEDHTTAGWMEEEETKHRNIPEMLFAEIDLTQLTIALKRAHNWKAPGPDRIQNFWYKRLSCSHQKMAELFSQCLQHPELFPAHLAQGITYLLPKTKSFQGDPSKGRPITCLNTIYKLMTSCISNAIYDHLTTHNIMAEEQKGCVRNAKGCKEQLTIDQVVLEQTTKNSRNLHTCYIDYQKCFDSLPHSWLLKVLAIYRISPSVINFLKSIMKNWQTVIEIARNTQTTPRTRPITIKKGIFQGDCLSALWFCVALNPLSNLLNTTNIGFNIRSQNRSIHRINHLVYMDDLKLYAANRNQLNELIHIVSKFSNDIKMKFGIDKCKTLSIQSGKTTTPEEQGPMSIQAMEIDELYKYLGIMQSKQIAQSDMKARLKNEFKGRLHKLLKAKLNGKNLIKAVNTYAIPVITYSFGIIKWTQTELRNLQRTIRTTMTQYNAHHPKSCTERMTLPRREGGRGLLDIELLHDKQIENLRTYFKNKARTSDLIRAIVEVDKKMTPLNLSSDEFQPSSSTNRDKEDRWAQKHLHGRYYHSLHDTNVDQQLSNRWLMDGSLYAETEGFMLAIQDEVISTRNYTKHIIKAPNAPEDHCRRCNAPGETIDHIISACPTLAQSDYLKRHNNVAKIIHLELLKLYQITKDLVYYYSYNPEPVVESEHIKIYYDRTIHTGHTREHNRPDITVIDKRIKSATLIDIAIPLSRNMTKTRHGKIAKYSELAVEIKTAWNLTSVRIVPIVISSIGLIPKTLRDDLASLHLKPEVLRIMQKAVIIDTCHTVRKFLQ
ncbi:hypothetical protein WDU94_000610 [Cyamophila willieti]